MKNFNQNIDELFHKVSKLFDDLSDSLCGFPQLGDFHKACLPVKYEIQGQDRIAIEARGYGHWAVTQGSFVLNKLGEWEYEPMPSGRSEEFIKRTRWNSAEAAFEAFKTWFRMNQKVK